MDVLDELRQWFGAKNNKNLILKVMLDLIFFSLFAYVAWQARDPAGWCVQNGGVPLDWYKNITNKTINWTLINSIPTK